MRDSTIVVAAAIVERGGRFLLTRRQKGVHLEGFWEFPGGKCDAGETLTACLRRELREELAVDASVGEEVFSITHAYPDRSVELHFFRCEIAGEPAPQMGQAMRWVPRAELPTLEFPPADAELIRTLSAV
ncbi:MAG TPA: (deoxy)nucleoside triphosphate pyrophosphohydrolase [Vicinamibacterales bacterium]|nr:(deoxy)nucleoside triphosphate pyrophosphohydrolase [Vicinamibacterales bacterium]